MPLPMLRLYIASNVINELHKNWDNFFNNSSSDSLYLQEAHSEGVNNVRLALMSYNQERAGLIQALLVATGGGIDHATGIKRQVVSPLIFNIL